MGGAAAAGFPGCIAEANQTHRLLGCGNHLEVVTPFSACITAQREEEAASDSAEQPHRWLLLLSRQTHTHQRGSRGLLMLGCKKTLAERDRAVECGAGNAAAWMVVPCVVGLRVVVSFYLPASFIYTTIRTCMCSLTACTAQPCQPLPSPTPCGGTCPLWFRGHCYHSSQLHKTSLFLSQLHTNPNSAGQPTAAPVRPAVVVA